MTVPGKNAPGLTGYPTPNEAAEEAAYLLLKFQDKTWAQYMLGALRSLQYGYNWYKSGEIDPDEAAEIFRLIVQQAPLNKLPTCSLPTGEPLMRVNPEDGHIQGVDEDGNWQDDPLLPPTPERPPDTPEQQRCDAAANTAHALELLYENLSDSWNEGLSTAEAITAFVSAVGTVIAAELFPPAAALIAAAGLIFEVLYAVIAYVGADVWTEDFNDVLLCYLFECASAADNVVTYDFSCVVNKLAAQTDVFDLSFAQLRLFGQLYYILQMIGVEGLNYSGAATTVVGADCSGCEETWCHNFDLTVEDGELEAYPDYPGTWVEGTGWDGGCKDNGGSNLWSMFLIRHVFSSPVHLTQVEADFHTVYGTVVGSGEPQGIEGYLAGTQVFNEQLEQPTDGDHTIVWTGEQDVDEVWFLCFASNNACDGIAQQTRALYKGTGDNPFGDTNC